MSLIISLFRLAVAGPLLLVALASCSKDDPKPADPTGMSWTAYGSNVTATTTDKLVSTTKIELVGAAKVGMVGNSIINEAVGLTIPQSVGTYQLTATSDASARYIFSGGGGLPGQNYKAESGTLTVTTLTATNVKGTFDFTGVVVSNGTTESRIITNGKFDFAL